MHRLIYVSRATRFFSPQGIDALTVTCRRNNAKSELTGILVYHENRFFQVLEGEEANLLDVMRRVTKDPRHMGLQLIEHGSIDRRAFSSWRMGYEMNQDQTRSLLGAFALHDLLPPDSPFRGRDPKVRNHVRGFLSTLRQLPQAATG